MARWGWLSAAAALLIALFVGSGCEPYQEPLPKRDRLNFPVGLALHPSGDYLYVVNSNFDSRYSPEYGGTVAVIDTESLEIRSEHTPYIPSYGGHIRLNEDATRAYVTARRGDSLVALDVSGSEDGGIGSALTCPGANGEPSSDPDNCIIRRVPDNEDGARVPADPFGLEVTRITRTNEDGERVPIDLINLSHLSGDAVTAIAIPDGEIAGASLISAPLLDGSNQIRRRPGTLEMYAAGRRSNRVTVYLPYVNASGEVEALIVREDILLNNVTANVDARGIAFDEEGERLYVATRRPDALHVFQLRPEDPETGQGTRHELERVIPVGDQPSDVVVHKTPEGKELIFVPCYDERSIHVLDPETGVVLREIELDESPYAIAMDSAPSRCVEGTTCRAYVTLFADAAEVSTSCDDSGEGCGSVAIIELDPKSPRYLQVTTKIR